MTLWIGVFVVILATVLNDWCIMNNACDPAVVPLAFHSHRTAIYLAGWVFLIAGCALLWVTVGAVTVIGGAVYFLFLSAIVNVPLLEALHLIPDAATRRQFPAGRWAGRL